MIRYFFVLLLTVSSVSLFSQELKCNIQVVASEVQGTNKNVYQTLQSELYEFINNRNWTKHVYSQEERIECNILIRITRQISVDDFDGTMQIQSRRPVYNSSYQTTILNHLDEDVRFKYVEFEPLEFSETEHLSNLTSMIAFYVYLILGFDYDSFSKEGGAEYFMLAEKIVNNAQNAVEPGWRSFDDNKSNRYWLIENILNEKYGPIREFMYNYHRLGLDRMYNKVNEARSQIADDLLLLREVYREKPNIVMPYYKLIFNAKADEFVNIFSEAFPDEKARVLNILNEIDAPNGEKYKKILNQQ